MNYPELVEELKYLLEQDQKEIRAFAKLYHANYKASALQKHRLKLRKNSLLRTKRMGEILNIIIVPTITNIGIDGSEAMAVLALHATLPVMKVVLKQFTNCYAENPSNIYYQTIPALQDRILILERRKQKFGTQWLQGDDGQPFLYPIEDFAKVNVLRATYGLEPLRKPRILALPEKNQQAIKRLVTINDQREPSESEYREYSQDYLT